MKSKPRIERGKSEGGFTLVELMLASGITLTAIVLAMGALMSISTTTQASAGVATALVRRFRDLVWIGASLGLASLYSVTPHSVAGVEIESGTS